MKNHLRGTAVFTAMLVVFFASAAAADISGDWMGSLETPNNPVPFDLHFSETDGSLTGTIDIQGFNGLPLQNIVKDGNSLSFELSGPNGVSTFTVTIADDGKTGSGELTTIQGQSLPLTLEKGTRPIEFADTPVSIEQLATAMKNMADYSVEMAEMMPEEQYSFKPVEELRTWGEQVDHISGSNNFFARMIFGVQAPVQVNATTKEEKIAALKASFKLLQDGIEAATLRDLQQKLPNGRTKMQVLLNANDHHTHTRGIMIMYLRLKEIAPPQFRSY